MNTKQAEIQSTAFDAWKSTGRRGTLAMATGVGKSRIGVMAAREAFDSGAKDIWLVTSTEILRDKGWKEEFEKWGEGPLFQHINRICYQSIDKLPDGAVVIFDEVHKLTPAMWLLIRGKNFKQVLGLTATPPRSREKKEILSTLCPVVFEYGLDEAEADEVVSPFDVNLIYFTLSKEPIKLVRKKFSKMTTEKREYDRIDGKIEWKRSEGMSVSKMEYLYRQKFLYRLNSRVRKAKEVIATMKGGRHLVFAPYIDIAERLSKNVIHSKSGKRAYNDFMEGKINELYSVNGLNEGHNLGKIDSILIMTANSNSINTIQRIGRAIRKFVGHSATINILVAKGTMDEQWVLSALKDAKLDYKVIDA